MRCPAKGVGLCSGIRNPIAIAPLSVVKLAARSTPKVVTDRGVGKSKRVEDSSAINSRGDLQRARRRGTAAACSWAAAFLPWPGCWGRPRPMPTATGQQGIPCRCLVRQCLMGRILPPERPCAKRPQSAGRRRQPTPAKRRRSRRSSRSGSRRCFCRRQDRGSSRCGSSLRGRRPWSLT